MPAFSNWRLERRPRVRGTALQIQGNPAAVRQKQSPVLSDGSHNSIPGFPDEPGYSVSCNYGQPKRLRVLKRESGLPSRTRPCFHFFRAPFARKCPYICHFPGQKERLCDAYSTHAGGLFRGDKRAGLEDTRRTSKTSRPRRTGGTPGISFLEAADL